MKHTTHNKSTRWILTKVLQTFIFSATVFTSGQFSFSIIRRVLVLMALSLREQYNQWRDQTARTTEADIQWLWLAGVGVCGTYGTSGVLAAVDVNCTVGMARWLAKKFTSPGICTELMFGGQQLFWMQLLKCLWNGKHTVIRYVRHEVSIDVYNGRSLCQDKCGKPSNVTIKKCYTFCTLLDP